MSKDDYLQALTVASKKAAKYLAQAAKDCQPDQVETFTLERENLEGLPRVAYLCNAFSHAPLTDFTLYGDSMQTSLPTIVHPNEFLDGAMLDRDYGQLINADPSYYWQNQPIILELYRRHGAVSYTHLDVYKRQDQIIVLDEGRIVGKGTHEELMQNCQVYQQIALSQLSKEELGA